MPTLLIAGAGNLAFSVLDQLAPRFPNWSYILVSRDSEDALLRLNLSKYVLSQWGLFPKISHLSLDLTKISETTEVLDLLLPDLVFNATTPFPWWRIKELPSKLAILADEAGPGIWAPLDVVLPLSLTKALGASRAKPIFVNGCYPDLTNAFLKGKDGAPLLGIGNISNLIPGFRLGYATEWGVSPESLSIKFIGHHFTSLNGPSSLGELPAPYLLEITSLSRNLTIKGPSIEPFDILRRHARRTRGEAGQAVTTGSASTVLAAFMSGELFDLHCPGPFGLPGGYPVQVENGEARLSLPFNLSVTEAREINSLAQKFDGIEDVGEGSIVLTEQAQDAQMEILGFTTSHVTDENCDELARKMIVRLNDRFDLELRQL